MPSPNQPDYPACVVEILEERMAYPEQVLLAIQRFAKTAPWIGSLAERKDKFKQLNHDLAEACGIPEPDLTFRRLDGGTSTASRYIAPMHRIVMMGKLSIVSYLHEFGHAMKMGEREACRWSINLFRRCFPTQYGHLVHVGHMLIRPADLAHWLPTTRVS
jgi:hypothetical protein